VDIKDCEFQDVKFKTSFTTFGPLLSITFMPVIESMEGELQDNHYDGTEEKYLLLTYCYVPGVP
jgi:hypothetical protein